MLAIIIPLHNEEKRLKKSLEQLSSFAKDSGIVSEIIFVDDGSTDATGSIITKYSNENPIVKIITLNKNSGKGHAVKTGMVASKTPFVLFSDADFSTPLTESIRLLKEMEHADIVIGSRRMKESGVGVHTSPARKLASKTWNTLRKTILLPEIKDSQCGFKLFNRKAVEIVFPRQTISKFAFDVEVLTIAKQNGLKIKEVGVMWNHDNKGNLKLFPTSLQMLKDILTIRKNIFFGIYKKPQ